MDAVASPLVMRRSIFIAAPPERVWQEFESIDRLRRWYAGKTASTEQHVLRYEPRVGGWFELTCRWTHGVPGACRLGGEIVVFDPPRELTLKNNSFLPARPWSEPISKTFRLSPASGGTVVEIIEHGFEVAGEYAQDFHLEAEIGWTMDELVALRRLIEGGLELRIPTGATAAATGVA
jgi:uncharacterized protein YndB with AHSA1/START domain